MLFAAVHPGGPGGDCRRCPPKRDADADALEQALVTDGQIGYFPEYYDLAKVALFWGISPERVIELPVYWVEVAVVISRAEAGAQEKLAKLRKMEGEAFGGFSGAGMG